ncbi:hypothetical protein GCM10009665_09560 [Kitasatospora nipponensis]|uniref:DUF2793 domain-containing protein n=1 Tax=Kitasatospora nipponensis TaxID=258049 RepID=A0ABN1VS97_9ACTN
MKQTPLTQLPYPEATDVVDVPTHLQLLATALDSRVYLRFDSTALRDAAITAPQAGQLALITGNGFSYYTGTAWVWVQDRPMAILTVTTPQAAPASGATAATALQFDTAVIDTAGGHVNASASRYTCQAGQGGWYWVRSSVCWAPNATGNRVMSLSVNGTPVPYAQTQGPASAVANWTLTDLNSHVFLKPGDYLETFVGQNSGAALAIVAAGTSMQVRQVHG